jgi:tRNA threonylcarbamoyladenosine biosynthesis protein TsaB
MIVLAVDTTTPDGSVAVVENDRVLAELAVRSTSTAAGAPSIARGSGSAVLARGYKPRASGEPKARPLTHSARLLASIHFLLEALGLDVRGLDGWAVSPGPGSFTGIRIGLSTVKALAFASGNPTAAVSSLAALAFRLSDGPARWVAPVLDAKKGEVYASLVGPGPAGRTAVPEGAYAPADFLRRIGNRRTVLFAGGGAELYRPLIEARLGPRAQFSIRPPFIAAAVGLLGVRILRRGEGTAAESLEPLYYRVSQAEEKR